MHVSLPIQQIREVLDFVSAEPLFAHADLDVETDQMFSLTVQIDSRVRNLFLADAQPKIRIFANGNFVLDFLGKMVEYAYDPYDRKLTRVGSEKSEYIASVYVFDHILAYSLDRFGSEELKAANRDYINEWKEV